MKMQMGVRVEAEVWRAYRAMCGRERLRPSVPVEEFLRLVLENGSALGFLGVMRVRLRRRPRALTLTRARGGLQFPENTIQPSHQQGQRLEKRHLVRPLQPAVFRSKQRSSRKHQKTRQSSLTNILQHIISGQGSALTILN